MNDSLNSSNRMDRNESDKPGPGSGLPLEAPALRRFRTLGRTLCLAALASAWVTGCGSNLADVLFQSAAAVGRTLVDQLLTDVANDLAQAGEEEPADGDDQPDDDADDDGNAEPEPPDDGSGDGAAGDPAAGQSLFAASGCGACHCADASGGCALSAPDLAGVSVDVLNAIRAGTANHPTSLSTLSGQDVADLAAYFGSL